MPFNILVSFDILKFVPSNFLDIKFWLLAAAGYCWGHCGHSWKSAFEAQVWSGGAAKAVVGCSAVLHSSGSSGL